MIKKAVVALALAVISASCLAACGNGNGGEEETTGTGITVTFDAGGGAFKSGQKTVSCDTDKNGKVKITQSPVRDGYAFAGWYNGDVKFNPSAAHTEDVVYTATYISGNDDRVYQKLFDTDTVVSFDINMSDAEWKKLDADYDRFSHHKSPIYRLADSVTVSIDSAGFSYDFYYEEVGIRMKGNTSRRHFYGDDGFYKNVHFKMSFGETFDDEDEYEEGERKVWADKNVRKERKNRTFGGMEKLDMKYNKNEDESYTKDVYAMKLFRANGIVAPHATLCAVSALDKDDKNKNLGVYMLYEAVDSVFLARNFTGDAEGDLYKCSWGAGSPANFTRAKDDWGNALYGVEDELNNEFYTYDKKTNKKVLNASGQRDFSKITGFISAVNSYGADYGALIDTDYFARFEAVNYILGNPDCIRNNYNNFYIYFRPSDGKAVFIPYDYDRCFGITKDWAPNNACLDLKPYDRRTSGSDQSNPLYVNLIVEGAPSGAGSVRAKYRDYLVELAQSETIKASEFDKVKNAYKSHYDNIAKTAIDSNNTRFDANDTGNYSYSYYITRKLEILNNNINF